MMTDRDRLLSALRAIDPADLDYNGWVAVGMALKEEGIDFSVWDEWSSRDPAKYSAKVCREKWNSFNGNGGKPVKGGTIIQMAKDRGWQVYEYGNGTGCLEWNDTITYDGDGDFVEPEVWDPVADLATYLQLLFEPEDHVGYVTTGARQVQDGKWVPDKGCYDRTAGELLASLKKYPDDISFTIGTCQEGAGAWIRFNPVDGEGVKNENVTAFRYALVESDTLTIAEQDALYRKLELPIVAMVHSGGKSLHAIVRVDANDADEYRKRVSILYDFLEKNGCPIDKQNRNPSRLSRMPGVMRGANRQYLVATNIGRKSWAEWMDFVEGATDELPRPVLLVEYKDAWPPKPEALIEGILCKGHKMLLSGPSKAGKSFSLIELAIAIAEGIKWLGFQCRQGKVWYLNFEIDERSVINRFHDIYQAKGLNGDHMGDITMWNLRGYATPLDVLMPKLIRRVKELKKDERPNAIIFDPIYKIITGDENNASEMGAFCNLFDAICRETECSTIYCHHHSKGAQGGKRAQDRASGSGVFARDPDAQLDMIELEMPDDFRAQYADSGATAWRLESSLREFENIKPVNFWFKYPIHELDATGKLTELYPMGDPMGNLLKSSKRNGGDPRERIVTAFNSLNNVEDNDGVTVEEIAEYVSMSRQWVKAKLNEMQDIFWVKRGIVGRRNETNLKVDFQK